MLRSLILVGMLALGIGGCSPIGGNPYSSNYRGERLAPAASAFYLDGRDELGPDARLLGRSTFAWNNPNAGDPLECARAVGANVALVRAEFLGTRSGAVPVQTYHPGGQTTTHSTYSGRAHDLRGGYAYGSASGVHTTRHRGYTTTEYVPYSVSEYRHYAEFYWDPSRPGIVDESQDTRP